MEGESSIYVSIYGPTGVSEVEETEERAKGLFVRSKDVLDISFHSTGL